MSQAKQVVPMLMMTLALAALLAACGGKAPVQPSTSTPPSTVSQPQPSHPTPATSTPIDGQEEFVWTKPEVTPGWVDAPNVETNQQYLAFTGISLDAAHIREARTLARRDAQVAVSNYLFTHVNERVKEVLKNSGVSSEVYDPSITEQTVREVESDAIFSEAYPSETYTEYFRRYERGRWVHYYRVYMLVKYPRDKVAVAAQDAMRRALERLKNATSDTVEKEKIQQGTETFDHSDPTDLPPPTSSRRGGSIWALLVGIDRYEDIGITPLHFAAQDAKIFAEALSAITPKDQVWLMTHEMMYDENPTNTNVLFHLERLAEVAGPRDTLIFGFSGHSMSRNGKHYLLSANADPRSIVTLENSTIPLYRLRQLLSHSSAHQVVLALDGCRNDPEAGKGDADNPLTDSFVKQLVVEPVEAKKTQQNYAVLFACSVGERAYEWPEKGQGVFSYFLVEGLTGKARDSEGRVTVTSLSNYLQQQVTAWSQKHRPSGRGQTPWLHMEGQPPMVLYRTGG